MGKLKAMGSATASSGAVGLYHVENVTPEAIDQGRKLLTDDYQTYVIDDAELARVMDTFENRWKDPDGDPTAVYIGCPHNTYNEILYWAEKIRYRAQSEATGKDCHSGLPRLLPRCEEQAAGRASRAASGCHTRWRAVHEHLHRRPARVKGHVRYRPWSDQLWQGSVLLDSEAFRG